MVFDLKKIQKKLGFDLDDNQKDVLLKTSLCISNKQHCCITGPAGSGKTQMAKAISVLLRESKIPYLSISPTNKAKLVLGKATSSDAVTCHTLLSLSPELDILELDMKKLRFIPKRWDRNITPKSVWLIDECSMINDDLFDLIIKKAEDYQCTVVFFGDESQLAPVKQRSISKVFTLENKYSLVNVYRQDYYKNGEFTDFGALLEKLRSKPTIHFPVINEDTGIKIFEDAREWIDECTILFGDALAVKDPNLVRVLSYTNNRISSINQTIRKSLGYKQEYEVGELLTGYDSVFDLGVENSEDYWVESVKKSTVILWGVPGYNLTLKNSERQINLSIVSENISETQKQLIAATIEKLRLKAIATKKGSDWAKYFEVTGSFAIPFDLMYAGKVVKKKTLGYGYCISVHKSQGSQFDNVFLDAVSINKCYDSTTKRQLQYVAASRTKGLMYVYQ